MADIFQMVFTSTFLRKVMYFERNIIEFCRCDSNWQDTSYKHMDKDGSNTIIKNFKKMSLNEKT